MGFSFERRLGKGSFTTEGTENTEVFWLGLLWDMEWNCIQCETGQRLWNGTYILITNAQQLQGASVIREGFNLGGPIDR